MHKHIKDLRKDLNYLSADINIFAETRFSFQNTDEMYHIPGYDLFRNDNSNPAMHQDLMVVQLCTVKSHTYRDIRTVTIYMVLK